MHQARVGQVKRLSLTARLTMRGRRRALRVLLVSVAMSAWSTAGVAQTATRGAGASQSSARQTDSVPATAAKASARSPKSTDPKPPARPDFKNLRFDETWTRANRTGHWDDEVKAIALGSNATLTLGGQVRWREEFAKDFNLSSVSDTYAQSRTLLDADLQVGNPKRWHARAYGEFRDAQSYDRDLPGGTRAQDADRADVQNLFVDAAFGRSFVRVGRQEIVAGRERLIGVPDWSNTRRGMQGVRSQFVRGSIALDAMAVRPVVVRLAQGNIGDTTTQLRVLALGNAAGAKPAARGLPAVWQAYVYEQQIDVATPTRRITSGGRVAWTLGAANASRSYTLEAEGARQSGSTGARQLRAWFWTAEAQLQWRRVRGTPTVALGLEEASGDGDSKDARLEAFNTLYAAAHQHGGFADVFGRTNARETHVISTWDPIRKLSLRGAWHRFDRLRLDDGVYNKQNAIMRAASGSRARHAGDEVDLTGTFNATRHLRLIAGHAWVAPGAFMRTTPGGARTERWGFVGTTFTF